MSERSIQEMSNTQSRSEVNLGGRAADQHDIVYLVQGMGSRTEVINKQVEEKKVIRSSQHGFTKGKSCLTNMTAFYNGMTSCVDEGRAVDIVYLDFSKAFDMVFHNIHLGKLRKCGQEE